MKKVWLFSPFILSMLVSPLSSDQPLEGEVAKSSLFGQKKLLDCSKHQCTSCCPPKVNYRLPSDFSGANTFVEYLIWQVQEQASHFVITPNDDSVLDPNYRNTEGLGTIRSVPFKWASGVRVGLGYTAERDAWQALGQYTWFSTEGKKSYSFQPTVTQFLMPTHYAQSTTGTSSASGKVEFSYQMADLLAARTFLLTEQIRLNFSFGGTGGYIKEDFHVTYGATNNTYLKNDWSFGGGGFRAAIDSNWHIDHGFGVFGRFSFATILGHYSNINRMTADAPINGPISGPVSAYPAKTTYKTIMLMPTTQIVLGFDWYRSFTNCWVSAVRAAVAAEFNNLANLHQVFKVIDFPFDPSFGKNPAIRDFSSVYMYGANVRVGADY